VSTNAWHELCYRRFGTRLERVRQAALATVLAVLVERHKDASPTGRGWALATKTFDLAVRLHLVVLQDGHLLLLALVLNLLRGVVRLFLALLRPTTQAENEVKSRFLLDVVVAQRASIFKLLSGKNQTLLVRWDTFLVLDFCLDIIDCIRRFHLKGDRFSGESFNEDLHLVRTPLSIQRAERWSLRRGKPVFG